MATDKRLVVLIPGMDGQRFAVLPPGTASRAAIHRRRASSPRRHGPHGDPGGRPVGATGRPGACRRTRPSHRRIVWRRARAQLRARTSGSGGGPGHRQLVSLLRPAAAPAARHRRPLADAVGRHAHRPPPDGCRVHGSRFIRRRHACWPASARSRLVTLIYVQWLHVSNAATVSTTFLLVVLRRRRDVAAVGGRRDVGRGDALLQLLLPAAGRHADDRRPAELGRAVRVPGGQPGGQQPVGASRARGRRKRWAAATNWRGCST